MKNKILSILFGFMTLMLLLPVWSGNNRVDNLNDQITHWQNQAAIEHVIEVVDSTAIKQLALQVDQLSSENDNINKQIKKQKATILSQVNTIAGLQDSLKNIDTGDGGIIIIDDDSVGTRTFDVVEKAYQLKGWFMINDPFKISFDKIVATIQTETTLTENKDGSYQVYIDSKMPNVHVMQTTPKIVPYDRKWSEKIRFGLGAYVGGDVIGLETSIGYNKFGVDIGFDSNSKLILGGKYYFN